MTPVDLTTSAVGLTALALFAGAYLLVILEEVLHLRKSVPMLVAAGGVWGLVGWHYAGAAAAATDPAVRDALTHVAGEALQHVLLEFAELMLFLLAAMTYVNTMEERGVFDALRVRLVARGFSLRVIYWITGALAFCISPVADNLTTALVMGTVALSVGAGHPRFVTVAMINIVVAANAGGVFSPFGDITTLMVWQQGKVPVAAFLALFLPALVNWLVPAALMATAVPAARPTVSGEALHLQRGAWGVVALFLATIAGTVLVHHLLHLPAVLGMMTGLGALKLYAYWLERRSHRAPVPDAIRSSNPFEAMSHPGAERKAFDIFRQLERAEWDTLLFFYGVVLCVGGLGTLGYLQLVSTHAYEAWGATWANVAVGLASAVVDNIPVMFAVLTANPAMDLGQWLLVTLTAGVGGSLLSVGSAAGVALMGQARGVYTFGSHLRWSWAVALGFAASIATHLWVNRWAFGG
jgi:Na+/H+ antiporter NhaD/arsenite permease-like protein